MKSVLISIQNNLWQTRIHNSMSNLYLLHNIGWLKFNQIGKLNYLNTSQELLKTTNI